MTIKEDEIRISKIKSFAEARAFLDEKKKVFGERYRGIIILLDKAESSLELKEIQEVLHGDERVMLLFRDALSQFKNEQMYADVERDCDKIVSELRVFDKRVDGKRKESISNEEKKEFNLLSFFSLGLLFPSAAKSLTEFFVPGNSKAAKAVTITVAGIGMSYHFRKNIGNLWKKVADKISEKDTEVGIQIYILGHMAARRVKEKRGTFFKNIAVIKTRLPEFSIRKNIGKKKEKDHELS